MLCERTNVRVRENKLSPGGAAICNNSTLERLNLGAPVGPSNTVATTVTNANSTNIHLLCVKCSHAYSPRISQLYLCIDVMLKQCSNAIL